MVSSIRTIALLGSAALGFAAPAARDQLTYTSQPERAAAVQEAFDRAWNGYYTYAFPHDELTPLTESYDDGFAGWGASAIDAISTASIMGDKKVVNQILDYIPTIDFTKANYTSSVSLFETTIRYLGGLLAAHDLLTGPAKDLVENPDSVAPILAQAVNLADLLSVAFDTPTGIPINDLDWEPPRPQNDTTNGLATIGTLVLEWTRLSDLTGNTTYAELAQKGEAYLLNPQPRRIGEPFPGLLGSDVDVNNGSFVDSSGSWGGGTDSFYEYLIKMYLYDTGRFGAYKDRWVSAIDSSIKYMTSHPTSRPDLTFLAGWYNSSTLFYQSQHLACFNGGNFILGGLTLDRQDYVDFGLELVAGCHDTYVETVTGIGPEIFNWQDSALSANATNNSPPPADQADFYQRAGYWIPDGGSAYVLRPEVIESYYYAYRATGDSKYQDWAWDAFLAINTTCSVGDIGFTAISNVNAPGGGEKYDEQESFFFAEVLKYSYMIQAEEAEWQVSPDRDNTWVFNTEAHPFKIAGNAA
ncbi:putative alpha-1,2-Mannosidase [Seiridium cardinale]|uniref:alpha-1,2-Mannosidase n=1 Tax=Seiridium cardinale TaxID=138064 RepID=A0ABR2XP48_9PEZI